MKDYVNLATAIFCILCAALASGLTIGLLVRFGRLKEREG
jgi:hypothetical protein